MRSQPKPSVTCTARREHPLLLKPLAQAIALMLLAGGAQAAPAFSAGWFAEKGAAQAAGAARPGTVQPGSPPPLAQQQQVQQRLGRSFANLNNTVAAIAAAQAAQAAGRAAASGAPQTLHNGLGGNGLNVVVGPDGKPLFINAEAPVQTDANGKVLVSIKQTADKAILNWETFNVGRDTTLAFQQEASWALLNKVGNSTAPSQIQGQIKADGTVMILNSNGVVFSGTSQVNVRNLVAAATGFSDEQFRSGGLYNGSNPSFTNAQGNIRVEQGAQLNTAAPSTSTSGGGYVLLLGKEVDNAGSISTPKGQVLMAAGDSFVIRKGYGSDGNPTSTTRGSEVSASGNGRVLNRGVLLAASGDVSLVGNQVQQSGVALASTSADARGTVHLTASGANGQVTLGEGSTTAILLDASATALDSQRDALLAPALKQDGDVVNGDVFRRDLSLVQIDSSGSVDFQKGSITLATGGQVATQAAQRSLVRDGAVIDVSGATGVQVAMSANSVKVNLQGNEQRDASVNRDKGALNNSDVWVDVRELVRVPAGTNGYATDRWYTAGGLLEVSGYLGTQGHSVAEWMALGGTVSFTGGEVVTQSGSQINLSGGTLDVQGGSVRQTWLKGADGRLYELSSAPGDILYTGIYRGYEDHSQRWGRTDYYYDPLIAPRERQEAGYTVGRDAGSLVIGTRNAVLEGTLASDTYQGARQTQAAQVGLDGYRQSQKAAARGGQLVVGTYAPLYVKSSGTLEPVLGASANTLKQVVFGQGAERIADGLDLTAALPAGRQGTLYLDSAQLNGFNLGAIKVAASEGIRVDSALQVAPAGNVTLYGPQVEVNADITARGGSLQLGNVLNQMTALGRADTVLTPTSGSASVRVGAGVHLDASGLWSNLLREPDDTRALPYLNGGSVSLRSSGNTLLEAGSTVDVSSGAALLANGKLQGGKGGNVTLAASAGNRGDSGVLSLGGALRGEGVKGGGTLSLQAARVLIADNAPSAPAGTLVLRGDFFDKGFSAYEVRGNRGLEVAEGTRVEVTQPLYRQASGAGNLATGGALSEALERWLPPLYQEDAGQGVLTQRQGASLSLQAGSPETAAADIASTALVVKQGALLHVDPGQAIRLAGIGQVTVDGTLEAWGGRISILGLGSNGEVQSARPLETYHSLWIGDHARLDAASRAVSAVDARGNRYGQVRQGGSIVIGGDIDANRGDLTASDAFVVVRQGARLDASGSQAWLDLPGQGPLRVASQGGSIALASTSGLYLDGQLRAAAGGEGAAGGSLSVALGATKYGFEDPRATDAVRQARELVVAQQQAAPLAEGAGPEQGASLLRYGQGRLALSQVEQGGFDNLALLSTGLLSFDGNVRLNLANALSLYAGAYGLTESAAADSRVELNSHYLRLAGAKPVDANSGETSTGINIGTSIRPATGLWWLSARGLLDVRDKVNLGARGSIRLLQGREQVVDRRAFAQVQLDSQGDLRLLASPSSIANAMSLTLPGDLRITAAQVYPGTGVKALVQATRIDIGRPVGAIPAQPLSAFGELRLQADVINQGGVLRAPLGSLVIGNTSSNLRPASWVNLLPSSLTSVSGAGLVIPYGGTVDGKTWLYDGVALSTTLLKEGQNNMPGKVDLIGQAIDVAEGAVVDVSGGGVVLGAGFVAGRGGSTDARFNPLVQYGPDGFLLPALGSNPVYAIVPGVQPGFAPGNGEAGAVAPLVGQQITVGAGVPGLPAGTYTLLPSTYALLPGAFRVEVNGLAGQGGALVTQAMRNGSWSTAGTLGLASGARDSLASQVILTPADVLRRYSQYNETTLSQYLLADAARLGIPAALMPRDAKAFNLNFSRSDGSQPSFRFAGTLLKGREEGGRGSITAIDATFGSHLEIVKAGTGASAGFTGISLNDADLNAIGAGSLFIGGHGRTVYGQGGNFIQLGTANGAAADVRSVTLRSGATLRAPEVMLISSGPTGGITVEQGASINTLGLGAAPRDSRDGYLYKPGRNSVLAVSNGYLSLLAPDVPNPQLPNAAPGPIRIGVCDATCSGTTGLYSDGTIATATDNRFELSDAVRYGTRNLTLAVGGINVGSAEVLADLASRNRLPNGLTLNQAVLDRLLRGDAQVGAPALETLVLGARDSLNFFGDASLDTYGADGRSRLKELVLTTPAIYGQGEAGARAQIRTANLVWNGAHNEAGAIIAGGAGSGAGSLLIDAERIEFGYLPDSQPSATPIRERLAVGFANVELNARERITANHKGGLAVYQRQDGYTPGQGFQYSGGQLTLRTPVLTGGAGSVNRLSAGGDIRISAPAGSTVPAIGGDALGAELSLRGRNLYLEGAVVLPSGKLTLAAEEQLSLGDGARIDLAGRKVTFNDVNKYSWGGDLVLESRHGDIRQAAGALIDLSAVNNQAGSLKATALAAGAGTVALEGRILGGSSGEYDAGGTWMPYKAGSLEVHAQRLGAGNLSDDFAALNQRLNQGQVFGARSFQLKQGDLVIGDGLKAGEISVSLDGGHLTVNGTVDASGERVGAIRLAGKQGLTLGSGARLDAHGNRLRVDSYGGIIDAPNRATVELSAVDGQLTLASGARIDLRHGTAASSGHDGRARGTLELNAPRLGGASAGDIAIDASGPLDIQGASLIAVNGVQRYDDARDGSDPAASGRPYQVIDQAYLDQKHAESLAFIDHALANGALLNGKLAGLNNAAYADAFHLRPGVELVSRTPGGDLVVQGDLDLSGYRYASLNPHTPRTAAAGSGEVGHLVIRAGGDLSVLGSINDGFLAPPATQDDDGWVLLPGKQPFNGDVVVPRGGIELQDGTAFPAGTVLNYDLPIKAMTLAAGTRLPADARLNGPLLLAAGTVLAAEVRNADGSLAYAAGTRLAEAVTLAQGMLLGAGTWLPGETPVTAMTWPKGVPLPGNAPSTIVGAPDRVVQAGNLVLALGALIPAGTDVKLAAGVEKINLRGGDGKGRNWAVAQMLPEGSQSWSLRAVAGADLQAADSRLVDPYAEHGELRLADTHYGYLAKAISTRLLTAEGALAWYGDESFAGKPVAEVMAEYGTDDELSICFEVYMCTEGAGMEYSYALGSSRFSVLRTGTGDLDLVSAGDFNLHSLYGLYTAGTSSLGLSQSAAYNQPRGVAINPFTGALVDTVLGKNGGVYETLVDGGASSLYRAWYPDRGGNLSLTVGGDLTGDLIGRQQNAGEDKTQLEGSAVSNWLWRQGGGLDAASTVPSAWWINFGTYVPSNSGSDVALAGFTGFGTLGGGNLDVRVAGDAGLLAPRGAMKYDLANRSQGLVLAVGSTGRLVDGHLVTTGGGDLNLVVGGALNPDLEARGFQDEAKLPIKQRHDLNGSLVNLRGSLRASAASYGGIDTITGSAAPNHDARESRAYDPFTATKASATGGLVLVPGDATVSLNARGDLVLGGVGDAGRSQALGGQAVELAGTRSSGFAWFSLWTDHTAIDLFAAGGNLTPSTQLGEMSVLGVGVRTGMDYSATDGRFVYPSVLRAVAPAGSLYYGPSAQEYQHVIDVLTHSLLLAPGRQAQLELLAGNSIYAGGYALSPSNAPQEHLATPFKPGFYYLDASGASHGDLGWSGNPGRSLFAFGGTGVEGAYRGADQPTRIYALRGDIVGVRTGEILRFSSDLRAGETWYEGARPTRLMAGRDIVNSGQMVGLPGPRNIEGTAQTTGNLFVHDAPTDVSVVSAGRDILFSSFNVAGPGTLEITAGRQLRLEDQATLNSLGAIVPGDKRPGADIALQAGAGSGPDYLAFALRYLDPANRLAPGASLGAGGVAQTYEAELAAWLAERFGFSGSREQALAYFTALAPEQQRIFARQLYFAELRAGGREYNDDGSPRFGSYLRGRNAIAALFPSHDVAGNPIRYEGDITLYGGAGVRTLFGGGIQMLTPGGQQVFGIEGEAPPASAGVITQGAGDIQLFAEGSVLLGQSRIMTTFGGDILAWSARGDINAGRGSKTTLVYTPPRRVYDAWGNVTLSPSVPSTGAGIATLAPIPEVPPGDMDLLAPLGTIDAGEAGIRVSGNVNIAALQVINAANIQVQGKSSGIPLVASVNTGALASASSAASSASGAAEEAARGQQRAARERQPSIVTVQVLGFGNERLQGGEEARAPAPTGYDANRSVQVLGAGPLDEQARSRLTEEEQRNLTL